eukprot:3337074-Pyramimonas_sp.AAC.1
MADNPERVSVSTRPRCTAEARVGQRHSRTPHQRRTPSAASCAPEHDLHRAAAGRPVELASWPLSATYDQHALSALRHSLGRLQGLSHPASTPLVYPHAAQRIRALPRTQAV